MKQKLWITIAKYLVYCINKELHKAIECLKAQVEVLIEQQGKQNKCIPLTNKQRIIVIAKAKRLSRKMLEQCTVLFTADTAIRWYNKLIAGKLMEDNKVRRLLVCDQNDQPIAVVSLGDLATKSHAEEYSGEVLEVVSEPCSPKR